MVYKLVLKEIPLCIMCKILFDKMDFVIVLKARVTLKMGSFENTLAHVSNRNVNDRLYLGNVILLYVYLGNYKFLNVCNAVILHKSSSGLKTPENSSIYI